ncbi:AAA family ATPase [Frigoribacterium sp. CFBP 13729]|uniref:helix-turn-helix transcriptional regulator n=1 Tax=Frigoribacterium sp. CFBP 13729 TaxID=2775293 RepID=UPI00177CBC57|nr:AAA family ATPase [Frigoribacterium sp. CFBP 13729]
MTTVSGVPASAVTAESAGSAPAAPVPVGASPTGVPRLPGATVSRPRLLRALDEASGSPVVVLRGPAGCGKTVLLADWARRHRRDHERVLWLGLDAALDGVPAADRRRAFWAAVGLALRASGRSSSALARLLGDDLAPAPSRSALVAAAAAPDQPLVLVLDDLDLLDDPAARADLEAVVGSGGRVRAVVATRSRSWLERGDVAAALDTVVVGPDALALTPAEAAVVVAGVLRRPVDASRVVALHTAVGGHAGAVVASARAVADRVDADRTLLVDRGGRSFEEALAACALDHVRASLARHLRGGPATEFVLRTSVVDSLPTALAARLADLPDADAAAAALDRAAEDGLGAWRTESTGAHGEFAYYAAVREALRSELDARRPDDARTLRQEAVEWALEAEQPMIAARAAAALLDMPLLSRVLQRSWPSFTLRHAAELVGVLGTLPSRRTARHPVVLAMTALAFSTVSMHHARVAQALEAAVSAVEERVGSVPAPDQAFLLAVEAQARRMLGDVARARAAAARAEVVLAALSPAEREEMAPVASFVHQQLGVTALLDGSPEEALRSFAAASGAASGPEHAAQRSSSVGASAFVHLWIGEVATGRALLAQVGDETAGPVALARAVLALEDFRPHEALRLVPDVEPLMASSEHWPIVLAVRASAMISLGQTAVAGHLVDLDAQAARWSVRSPTAGASSDLLATTRVRLMLAVGRVSRAEAELEHLPADDPTVVLRRGAAHLLRADARRAADTVSGALLAGVPDQRVRSQLLLLRAVAELRLDRAAAALATFTAVLDALAHTGLRTVLLTVPRDDLEQLVAAATASGDPRAEDMLGPGRSLAGDLPADAIGSSLSEREAVVLRSLATERSLPSVAAELHVSVNTVKTQLRSVYRKLGVSGRREAVEAATQRGLIGG